MAEAHPKDASVALPFIATTPKHNEGRRVSPSPLKEERSCRRSSYAGSVMVMLLKVALQPSAKTPMCAPPVECVMREPSAFMSSM